MSAFKKPNNFAIILLAAGASSRLGQPKQLVKLHQQTLIERQCGVALTLSKQVYCVLGFQASNFAAKLRHLDVNIVINEHWKNGLSSSIAAGVNAMPKQIEAVMILLVDQWQLSTENLAPFVHAWQKQPKNIIVAQQKSLQESVNQQLGPPTIFPREFFSQLTTLSGDQGAKFVLKKNNDLVHGIVFPEAFNDLDTPEQLAQLMVNTEL